MDPSKSSTGSGGPRPSRALRSPEPPRVEGEPAELALGRDELGAGASISEARLVDVDINGARVAGLRLADVVVDRGNLSNLAAPELSVRRVVVNGARLTGAQWTRGTISDTVFRDCRIDLATFAGTTFERATFDGCDLTEADLAGVRIDRCELRDCTLDGLTGLERLRGAAMPWADIVGNAALLAAALGIRVLDEDER